MLEAVKFQLSRQTNALLLDPGLAKTAITLASLRTLFRKDLIRHAFIVAPLRVCFTTWPDEIAKWREFNHLTYKILHGPKKEQLLEQETMLTLINPDGLEWLLDVKKERVSENSKKFRIGVDLGRWQRLGVDVLVIDELTKFKHTTSDRFRALKLVHHTVPRRWGLTGSPAANGLEDLFGQLYIIDQGRSLGPYITHYRRSYFLPRISTDPTKQSFGYTLRVGADQLIYQRIAPLALRMSADDKLKLPPVIVNPIAIELPDSARRVYDELEDDLFTKLDEGRVVLAANAGVATGKCRQVTGGAVYLTPDVLELVKRAGKKEWVPIHSEKVEALKDLVEQLQGQPLLVGYEFEHELERLRVAFPEALFVKDVPAKRFKERIETPWNRGELELVIGQSSSMHLGLNMQGGGEHLCFFTLPWDFEVYDQLIRRLRRQGSRAKRITCHVLQAKGTVDVVVAATLRRKNATQQDLFTALVEYARLTKRARS